MTSKKVILFPQLNFPPFHLRIRKSKQSYLVFDPIRKKEYVLTPEEWVRQHAMCYLIENLKYPASLMQVELLVKINGMNKRADIVCKNNKMENILIVECKAPKVPITEATFLQAARYNFKLNAKAFLLTNGLTHYCCLLQNGKVQYLPDIPTYSELVAF